MLAKCSPAMLRGAVRVPDSKSFLHRIYICAALCKNPVPVRSNYQNKDIQSTISCLTALGASFSVEEEETIVSPILHPNSGAILFAGESGSTLRFMLPLLCALGVEAAIACAPSLAARPMAPLIALLNAHGARVSDTLNIEGALTAGNYVIDGSLSSQYVSGLLMALPLLKGDSTLTVTGKFVSKGYVDITLQVLRRFGIVINPTQNGYLIRGGQVYTADCPVSAEGDYSNAAFFAVGAAIGGEVTLGGLNIDSVQGDIELLQLLRFVGAHVDYLSNGINVRHGKLRSFCFSANACPDLVPPMAVLAGYCDGVSAIRDIGRLRYKESDRVESVCALLAALGIGYNVKDDTLFITGGAVKGGKVDGCNDHRIVMSAAIAALGATGTVTIKGAEAVNKSYPDFFAAYNLLGGVVSLKKL